MEADKKISTILRKESSYNNLKKETFQMRLNLLKNNSIDNKITNSIIFSMPIYLVESIALAIIAHVSNYSLPISNILLPGIIVSSSLVGGILTNSLISKMTSSYETMKKLTGVESDKEIEEELIRNEIELAKVHNRNLALSSYIHHNRGDNDHIDLPIRRLKSEYEELKIRISNKLSDLDTLTTKNYLIKKFGVYFNNVNKLTYLVSYPLLIALTLLTASATPLLIASINPTIFSNIVIPLLVGEVCGIAYQTDKINRYKDLYHKFNEELGKDKIKSTKFEIIIDGSAKDQNEYKINNVITDIIELVEECKILEDAIEQKETSDNDQEIIDNTQNLNNIELDNGINEKPLIHKLEPKRTNH